MGEKHSKNKYHILQKPGTQRSFVARERRDSDLTMRQKVLYFFPEVGGRCILFAWYIGQDCIVRQRESDINKVPVITAPPSGGGKHKGPAIVYLIFSSDTRIISLFIETPMTQIAGPRPCISRPCMLLHNTHKQTQLRYLPRNFLPSFRGAARVTTLSTDKEVMLQK